MQLGWRIGAKRSIQHGFTLLEMLIVIVLLGIIAGFAVLSFPTRSEQEQLQEQMTHFVDLFTQFRAENLYRGQVVAIRIQTNQVEFLELAGAQWQVSPYMHSYQLPDQMHFTIQVDAQTDQPVTGLPQIILLPTGEQTPITLGIASASAYAEQFVVDGMGEQQWLAKP